MAGNQKRSRKEREFTGNIVKIDRGGKEEDVGADGFGEKRCKFISFGAAAETLAAEQLAGHTAGAALIVQIVKMDQVRLRPRRFCSPDRMLRMAAELPFLWSLPFKANTFIFITP